MCGLAGVASGEPVDISSPFETLQIRVYDNAGLTADHRSQAIAAANSILSAASIDVEWHDCVAGAEPEDSRCAVPVDPHELVIRLVSIDEPEDTRLKRPLGNSLIDKRTNTGTLGTVFSSRVDWLAMKAGIAPSLLMGRAIAHELGHLLFGDLRHSREGLMRAVWTATEVRRGRRRDWVYSASDQRQIRVLALKRLRPRGSAALISMA